MDQVSFKGRELWWKIMFCKFYSCIEIVSVFALRIIIALQAYKFQ
jgi:hypothetical protein